jgi:hypothetical protein
MASFWLYTLLYIHIYYCIIYLFIIEEIRDRIFGIYNQTIALYYLIKLS